LAGQNARIDFAPSVPFVAALRLEAAQRRKARDRKVLSPDFLSRRFAFFAGQNVLVDPNLSFPIFYFPKFHLFRPLP
jgi:hypothetical protein